jgi:cytochrome c551/c552
VDKLKNGKLLWLCASLLLGTLVLAACGNVDQNSTQVSQDVRPATVISGAQQNVQATQGVVTDPTKSLTLAAGATGTPLPTPAPGQTVTPAPGGAATTAPAGGGATGNAQAGLVVFNANGCVACHPNGGRQAGVGPRLQGTARDNAYITNVIKNGRGTMPAYPQLNDTQINDLIAYMRSL